MSPYYQAIYWNHATCRKVRTYSFFSVYFGLFHYIIICQTLLKYHLNYLNEDSKVKAAFSDDLAGKNPFWHPWG